MRTSVTRPLAAGAAVVAASVGLTLPAAAAAASLQVSPTVVTAGHSVTASGTCQANSVGFVISHAFLHDATHDFAGVGAVSFRSTSTGSFTTHPFVPGSTPPGSYGVTARCGGGNLGVEAHLVVRAPARTTMPRAVQAGTGGLAANTGTSPVAWTLEGAGAVLALAGAAGLVRWQLRR